MIVLDRNLLPTYRQKCEVRCDGRPAKPANVPKIESVNGRILYLPRLASTSTDQKS